MPNLPNAIGPAVYGMLTYLPNAIGPAVYGMLT
jgi:hypothetical protein